MKKNIQGMILILANVKPSGFYVWIVIKNMWMKFLVTFKKKFMNTFGIWKKET